MPGVRFPPFTARTHGILGRLFIFYQPCVHLRLYSSYMPTILSTSFWKSMVPKPLRSHDPNASGRQKQPNPATFYTVILTLIGSMAIHTLSFRRESADYDRRSTVRVDTLKEVVEKIKKGEHVDVENELGTSDPEKELAWEELIREIERDEEASDVKQKQRKPSKITERVERQTEKTSSQAHAPGQPSRPTFH